MQLTDRNISRQTMRVHPHGTSSQPVADFRPNAFECVKARRCLNDVHVRVHTHCLTEMFSGLLAATVTNRWTALLKPSTPKDAVCCFTCIP